MRLTDVVRDYYRSMVDSGHPPHKIEPLEVTEAEYDTLVDETKTYLSHPPTTKPQPWREGAFLGNIFGISLISR